MSRQHRREIFSEINITPLTDIFLVLLIIMMVIAPMLDSKGLKLAVPTVGASKTVTQEPKALVVHISSAGEYLLNDQPVSAASLQQRLFQGKGEYPDGLIIEAAPDATHGAIVQVMDSARSAGIEKIAVTQTASR